MLAMATREQYSTLAAPARLDRLSRTPDEVAAAIAGRTEDALGRRPGPDAWSPREIVCHLRDVEELFQTRFHTILGALEPEIFVLGAGADRLAPWGVRPGVRHPLDPDQWAEDRQYARQDTGLALEALRRRRAGVLALLGPLTPDAWERGGIHLQRGRLTLAEWVAGLAAHDDNHLDQLRRAVDGRP